MLVNYDDGNDYPCKLIVYIPGEYNKFEGYQLIVQEGNGKTSKGFVLFQDHAFFPKLTIIDANAVNGPCFVIESDSNNKVVISAK